MTRRLFPVLVLILLAAGTVNAGVPQFESPQQRERFQELIEQFRCLVCKNQSLASSGALLAEEMRREILELMKAGKSNEEIREYLVYRYGHFVLYDPPMMPGTWALWFGPLVLLLVGGAAFYFAIRRRKHAPEE